MSTNFEILLYWIGTFIVGIGLGLLVNHIFKPKK